MRILNRIILILLLFTILLGSAIVYFATRPSNLTTLPATFTLPKGASLVGAAQHLQKVGILVDSTDRLIFVWIGRILGMSTQVKAGNYQLKISPSTFELLNLVTKGQVIESQVSIIEGWTFNELRGVLNVNPDIRHDTLGMSDEDVLRQLGLPGKHAEGLFFPDTYYFTSGTSDLVLLQQAQQTMQKHLDASWAARSSNLPFSTPYQALILASIVEKETGQAHDRDMIAGVFVNRLKIGMKLQTDPTVIYGMGKSFDGNLRQRDLLKDTPYNTYTRYGLPPTPIALPGLASLQAVVRPAKTKALYFVARGDGTSEFSSTLRDHNNAVNRYQKRR
ncbi:MAG: endolytic transglycosylase MltG [Candidatus Nitrotoga sp.]